MFQKRTILQKNGKYGKIKKKKDILRVESSTGQYLTIEGHYGILLRTKPMFFVETKNRLKQNNWFQQNYKSVLTELNSV